MKLTGRTVFIIFASFFGVIFTVNFTMAWLAVSSFPGLETRNPYMVSQQFQEDRAAQESLGWQVAAWQRDGVLTVAFTDGAGAPVEVAAMDAVIGRATHVADDVHPAFAYRDGTFTAPVALAPGNWNVRLTATAPDGTDFRQRVVLRIE